MSTKKPVSPYQCLFCRESLTLEPLAATDFVRFCLGRRRFQCPHCFEISARPFAWLGRIPLLGRVFRARLLASRPTVGFLPQRAGDISQTHRRVFRFSHWLARMERRVWRLTVATFRGVWNILWFVPRKLTGRKSRSRGKFLK